MARYDSAFPEEKPAQPVTLAAPFYMGKHHVTQEQYQQAMSSNPSHFKARTNPVESVSWDEAQEFCKKLSGSARRRIRLPTEAEWEYACRAGTATLYHSGDTEPDLARVAWYAANSMSTPHPVGQLEPNAFGLYDMHGNVWHWCLDFWSEKFKPGADMPQASEGNARALRGGSWFVGPMRCRSACRFGLEARSRYRRIGFRIVAEVDAG